jgi:hydroxyethylthiazole kinase-like uncharacterized protein yjeF
MTGLLTTAQMRAVETAAMAAGAATGLTLMERAGFAVAEAALERWPGLADPPRRALVLCGPGNNGGDGWVIARLLRERGWEVAAVALGDPDRAPPDAAESWRRWRDGGGSALSAAPDGTGYDLAVDALFGAGLTRDLSAQAAAMLAAARRCPLLVAVDGPSGLCLDSGRALGAVVAADLTVAFHAAKPGHHLGCGPELCGRLVVAGIGLDPSREAPGPPVALARPDAARLTKRSDGHKYHHGHALILGGGVGRGGAARMAARAALRVGAGLVTLGVPGAALIENAARLDAVMLRRVNDAADLDALLADRRFSAVLLGPGLGVDARTRALALGALASGRPVALDADALTAFAEEPAERAALLAALRTGRGVLTPHGGEFARLFPAAAALASPLEAARAAAAESGATVLLKGRATVIAAPDGAALIHSAAYGREAPWLATAGAGDVLAGLIVGLLARGFDPASACATAAWLHVEAARHVGPGLIAEDLPEALPAVLRALAAAPAAP